MFKLDLTNPIYSEDDKAREHLEAIMWPNGPVCPRCGVTEDRITKLTGKSTRPGVYKCKDCRKPFTVTVGTVMERSKIPLTKWLLAAQLKAASKKGISALQLSRMLNLSYDSAWFLTHRLNEACATKNPAPIGGENKVVEVDETYVGGKARNKAFGPPPKKMAVVTLVERDGESRSFHVANVTAKTLRPLVVKTASRKSALMTDESPVYKRMGREFASHSAVNHSKDEYARLGGFVHSNTAESFFALLKRGVYGTFHSISAAHLHRYLAEFDFRYAHRHVTDTERTAALLKGAAGKRLMYHQPSEAPHA
jgi:transposase-like protein